MKLTPWYLVAIAPIAVADGVLTIGGVDSDLALLER